jgi:hypothetical protein
LCFSSYVDAICPYTIYVIIIQPCGGHLNLLLEDGDGVRAIGRRLSTLKREAAEAYSEITIPG